MGAVSKPLGNAGFCEAAGVLGLVHRQNLILG